MEPYVLIYAGAKLVSDKIGVPLKNPNKNTKPGWESRLEKQVKKLGRQAKVLIKEKKKTGIDWNEIPTPQKKQ